MKIELNKKEDQVVQTEEIDFDCSEMNTTVHFPDFEINVSERTLVNSDRHVKKHKQHIGLKIRRKELLREQIRLEIQFLRNKLKLFSIQTDGQLEDKLSGMEKWMANVTTKMAQDQNQEKELLEGQFRKSFLQNETNLETLDECPSLVDSSTISASFNKK